jgi:hypothetical protein
MRSHEIENWARQVIRRQGGGQQEDSLVELKAKWPEPRWTARQLAGHANAARGVPILWLIGVDGSSGVVGCEDTEVGDWYNQIRAEFDGGVAPTLLGHPTFEHAGRFLVPLVFTTDRPPYVIRNPARDTPKSGPFSLEVPWREGTNVRSAGRAELLAMLTETAPIPAVEILRGQVVITPSTKDGTNILDPERWTVTVEVEVYISPRGSASTVIPFHRCITKLRPRGGATPVTIPGGYIREGAWRRIAEPGEERSRTITATLDELIIDGPGKSAQVSVLRGPAWASVPDFEMIEIEWRQASDERTVMFAAPLETVTVSESEKEASIIAAWLITPGAA